MLIRTLIKKKTKEKEKENGRFMTTGEVARFFGVSYPTVVRWTERGYIPCVYIGGTRRFVSDDIQAIVRNRLDVTPEKK